MCSREEMKVLLDTNHQWPSHFTFKFIVPKFAAATVRRRLQGEQPQERASSKGQYISFSLTKLMPSADSVLDMYDFMRDIPGLVSI